MNKKWSIFSVFILLLSVVLVACSGEEGTGKGKELHSIKDEAARILDTYAKGDIKAIEAVSVSEEATEGSEPEEEEALNEFGSDALKAVFENMTYKVGDIVSENEQEAVVKVTITNANVGGEMERIMGELLVEAFSSAFSDMTEEEMDAKMEKSLSDKIIAAVEIAKDKPVSSDVEMTLQKEEGKWKVVPDDAFMDAVTGGMISGLEAFSDSIEMKEDGSSSVTSDGAENNQ